MLQSFCREKQIDSWNILISLIQMQFLQSFLSILRVINSAKVLIQNRAAALRQKDCEIWKYCTVSLQIDSALIPKWNVIMQES